MLLVLLAGCRAEGSFSGECLDGLDNDQDGLVDCEDEDCEGSSECEGDAQSAAEEERTVLTIDMLSCSYTSTEWAYFAMLRGWASDVLLDWHKYEGGYTWEEWHYLADTSSAAYDSWVGWQRTIPIVNDQTQQQNDVNTLFQGNDEREDTLTWMITAFDQSGARRDCVVWGERPEYYGIPDCWEASAAGGRVCFEN